jgi:hypothetical protein
MKKIAAFFIFTLLLGACDAFGDSPQPVATWLLPPSRTPNIVTATPFIVSPNTQATAPGATALIPITATNTEAPSPTPVPPTETPTITPTSTPVQSVAVDILGCNTGLDITHGMGEVTNAYVTLKNTGEIDLPNACALLRAKDEGREHPNKKVCVANLPVGNQVTLKLTVDSTYQQETAIQVDASSNDVLLLRVDKLSCADISLFGGEPADLGVVKPIQ